MSMSVSAGGHVDAQEKKHDRMQIKFPGFGIQHTPSVVSPEDRRGDIEGKAGIVEEKEELKQAAAAKEAPVSLLQRVLDKYVRIMVSAASKSAVLVRNTPKVTPTAGLEASTKNINFQLTEAEILYLEYIRKSIGEGQFAHYRMPA